MTRPASARRIPARARRTETGAALMVALVFLLLITLLGLAGMQTVSLEEKMAGNGYDRQLALQAAEVALRIGEGVAETQSKLTPPNSGFPAYTDADTSCPTSPSAIDNCTSGLCPAPDKDCAPRWETASFTGWANASVSLGSLAGSAPQYFVEFLGETFPCDPSLPSDPTKSHCKRYRVTARGYPGTGRAAVVLQSIYATD